MASWIQCISIDYQLETRQINSSPPTWHISVTLRMSVQLNRRYHCAILDHHCENRHTNDDRRVEEDLGDDIAELVEAYVLLPITQQAAPTSSTRRLTVPLQDRDQRLRRAITSHLMFTFIFVHIQINPLSAPVHLSSSHFSSVYSPSQNSPHPDASCPNYQAA